MSDYWATHTVEDHKKFLESIEGLSVEETQKRISARFGEDNWLYQLRMFLTKEVNARVSSKMKERYNNERMIFELRNKIETDVILSMNWFSFFENEMTLEELNEPIGDFPLKTLMLVVIEALKQYADNSEELNPKALSLHELYLKLKETLSSQIPFESGDGFLEYLQTKQHRTDLEDARITGDICPFCESTEVRSYDSQKWLCRNCGKLFRKHRAKKEEED